MELNPQTHKPSKSNIVTVAYTAIVTLLFFIACTSTATKPQVTQSIAERKHTASLVADSIVTIVSDSGIIRYRITTPHWSIYDRADTQYWDFPQGLRFERFDPEYNIDAEIECDRALYFNDLELWQLNDNVRAVNLEGEEFLTEELFWNQKTEEVYSDSAITINQKGQTIYGIGFHSNQTFTKYTIKAPKGSFPIKDDN